MKKVMPIFLILFTIVFLSTPLYAMEWHTANQVTLGWDEVTTNTNGDVIPASDIQYRVFIKTVETGAGPTELGVTTDTTYTVTLNTEGQYYLGVRTDRLVDGEVVSSSPIAWSDDPTACQDNIDFGVRYYLPMTAPSRLRLVTP